ncbi:MAG: glycosyltransferase family 2 protein [Lachnospiraceae bacterium]|nr:glycosyltransferase family 2 protein [Lachnospiraceae bacterium]
MKVAVIIPNYNGLRFMDPCMSALSRQTYRDFRVIIVDNGSTDGSKGALKKYEDEGMARVILLPANTGFSGAVNEGITAAISEGAEYIVLLNNDTEAEPDYLLKMVRLMEEPGNEKVGAVSPLMISMNNHTLIDSAGDGYSLCGWAFQRGTGRKVILHKFDHVTDVFSACAGAAMYRAKALSAIASQERHTSRKNGGNGGRDIGESRWFFDPMHFAYLEDVDVSMRMRIAGYKILYTPDSRVYHFGSGTSGSKYNDFKVRLAARNNVWLNYKNMPLLMLLINLPFILLGVIVKQLFFVNRGFGKQYFNGFCEGIKKLPKVHEHKVRFRFKNLGHYVMMELHMITDMFSYLQDLICRKFGPSIKGR